MRISELSNKEFIGTSGAGDNSYFVINFDVDAAPAVGTDVNPPITYRVALNEIGRALINNLKLVQYNNSGNALNTLTASGASYSSTNVGQFITSEDRGVLDNAITDVSYDTTNKKFTKATRNGTAADIVTTASLLTDMDLNITQITNGAGKTIATINESGGKVSATFQDISILSSQVSDKSDSINSNGSTLATSKAVKDAIESLDITQITNNAGKTVATIDEVDGKVSATFQDISILSSQVSDKSDAINSNGSTLATSKAVKDALESLDITQISNTAGKTVATIDEADGKVSATFQDISILSSQISDKGTANCVATLDANGHVPASQLPSYVDDVEEYAAAASFPATGESGKIYVDLTTNTSYRWGGSTYIKVASDLSLGETSSTAYRGDYGAAAYAHAVTNKGIEVCVSTEDETTHVITKTPKFVKVQTNGEGHIVASTAVASEDIVPLIPIATDSTAGLVKVSSNLGVILNTNNILSIQQATESQIKIGTSGLYPIAPARAHIATFYGLAKAAGDSTQAASDNAVGTYTTEAKVAIRTMLDIPPTTAPTFATSITIGNTTMTEAQLQALLALAPASQQEGF